MVAGSQVRILEDLPSHLDQPIGVETSANTHFLVRMMLLNWIMEGRFDEFCLCSVESLIVFLDRCLFHRACFVAWFDEWVFVVLQMSEHLICHVDHTDAHTFDVFVLLSFQATRLKLPCSRWPVAETQFRAELERAFLVRPCSRNENACRTSRSRARGRSENFADRRIPRSVIIEANLPTGS